MSIPTVDLTEAAKAYNMQTVPPVVLAPLTMEDLFYGDPEAAYDNRTGEIEIWPDVFDAPDDYDQGRFAKVGVGPLDATGKAQFIIAHELWHAKQGELHGVEWLRNVAAVTKDTVEQHDSNCAEQEADQHAAQVYTLVKIGD